MNTVPVRMDAREREMYETLKGELFLRVIRRNETEEIDAKNASVLCNKLSQMANGAVYSEDGKAVHIHNRKLEAVKAQLTFPQPPERSEGAYDLTHSSMKGA